MGGIVFGATILTMIGAFQAIAGLAAIIDDNFFRVNHNYSFDLNTTSIVVIALDVWVIWSLTRPGVLRA